MNVVTTSSQSCQISHKSRPQQTYNKCMQQWNSRPNASKWNGFHWEMQCRCQHWWMNMTPTRGNITQFNYNKSKYTEVRAENWYKWMKWMQTTRQSNNNKKYTWSMDMWGRWKTSDSSKYTSNQVMQSTSIQGQNDYKRMQNQDEQCNLTWASALVNNATW